MSEQVKRYSPDTNGVMRAWDDGEYVEVADYAALAQRCRGLEAASVMPGFLANPIIETLRADNDRLRDLIDQIQQIVTHPHENKDALAARVRNILEAGK